MPETINIFIFKLLVFSIQSHPPNINHPFTQISVYKLHKTMFFLGGCFILVEQTLHPLLCPFLFDHIEVSWNSGTPKTMGFQYRNGLIWDDLGVLLFKNSPIYCHMIFFYLFFLFIMPRTIQDASIYARRIIDRIPVELLISAWLRRPAAKRIFKANIQTWVWVNTYRYHF